MMEHLHCSCLHRLLMRSHFLNFDLYNVVMIFLWCALDWLLVTCGSVCRHVQRDAEEGHERVEVESSLVTTEILRRTFRVRRCVTGLALQLLKLVLAGRNPAHLWMESG